MKTEFVDVTETRKNLVIEIPAELVEEEIDRHARSLLRTAKVPGFRPGKVPMKVVRQRYRDHLLHETAEHLIPRAVDEALRERGVEPVDTPEIHDVAIEEGQPLKFTASFETVPPIDPGAYDEIQLRRPPAVVEDADVDRALEAGAAAGRASRTGGGAGGRGGRHGGGGSLAADGGSRRAGRGRASRERHHRDRRGGEPTGVRRAGGWPRGGCGQVLHRALPGRLLDYGTGRVGRAVRGDAEGNPAPGRAGAGRRVREGRGRIRHTRGAAVPGEARPGAGRGARGGTPRAGGPAAGAGRSGGIRGPRGPGGTRRSTVGSRSSCAGWLPSGSIRGERESTGRTSGATSATRRPSR